MDLSMEIYKGKIKNLQRDTSGIQYLILENDNKEMDRVACESATIVALYGYFATGMINQEIYWVYDDMGIVMGGFVPVEEASGEITMQYALQKGQMKKVA